MTWSRLPRRRRDEDLDDEIAAHFRMAVADRIARGESPAEAERNARREFGNPLLVSETTRDMWAWAAWDRLAQDLKFGLRRSRANKTFTSIAVLTLALGIGVNTAIFSLLHAVLFNKLPVTRPAELYRLGKGDNCCEMTGYQNGQDFALFSYDLYKTLRGQNPEIQHLAAFQAGHPVLNARRAGRTDGGYSFPSEFVSSNYFDLFGIRPALGGFFTARDEIRGAPPTIVLSYRAWQTYLEGDRGIPGATLIIKGKPFTVIGVAPPGFYGDTLRADPPDCWLPAATEPYLEGANSLQDRPAKMWLYLMGRIPPGVALGPLEAKINVQTRRWYLDQAGPELSGKKRRAIQDQFVPIIPASGGVDTMSLVYREGLLLLMTLASLVLLIACANVANLLLARGTAMRGQNSLKLALGASRVHMLRQALTDSLLLALLGGAAGLVLAFGATRMILLLAFHGAKYVPIDARPSSAVLAFAIAASILTGLLFGIVPAWLDARSDPAEALRGSSRTTPAGALLPQKLLVIVQATLSLVLLTGAGLLARSLYNLENQNFGFRTDHRVVVGVVAALKEYTPERLTATYRALEERLTRIPGVADVGLAMYLPMTGMNWNTAIWSESADGAPRQGSVSFDRVSPGYFDAIGTRLIAGRRFDESDRLSTRRVGVVNQMFASRYCDGRNPIGMRFGTGGPEHAGDYEVVGVVEDAKYLDTSRPAFPTFFLPLYQPELSSKGALDSDGLICNIALHVRGGTENLEPLLRKTIPEVDANLGVLGVSSYAELLSAQFNQQRLIATLTELFGALALALAAIGLYGLVALAAGRRAAEIGVRMALGASRGKVVAMILRGALFQVVLGVAIGVPLSLAGAGLIQHQLFGVSAHNPGTLAVAALLLIACAAGAAVIPASRAARIDPIRALRVE